MAERKNVFKVIAIVLLSAIAVFCFTVAFGNRDKLFGGNNTTEETTLLPDGFYRNGENWCYFENGAESDKNGKIEGTVDGKTGIWITVDGKVDFDAVSLESTGNGGWQYVKDGAVTEKTSDEASLILGGIINSVQGENEIVTFGNFDFSEEKKAYLQSEIDKVNAKGYKTGIVVMNLNSLEGFSYNADEKIYSASTIKGPYIVSLVKSDGTLLDKEKTRIEATLIRSSNYDYESLRADYGNDHFVDFSGKTGNDLVIDLNRKYQYLTPRKLAHLWAGSYVFFQSGETGERLGVMFEKPDVSPINKAFSGDFKTRTKAGWITKNNISVTSDAGIVYSENGDWLVVIMTTAPCDFSVVENLAQGIKNVIF